MAFDTLHRLRTSQRLPTHRVRVLAALLDFGACANAAFDGKKFCPREFYRTRQLLEDAGCGSTAEEYWRRIQELERRRPCLGGDRMQFQRVRTYREDVVQLSLGVLTTTVFGLDCLDDGIQAIRAEDDLAIVFRIVMQCQIIDDVVDYSKDAAAGLPSFLTAPESLEQAFELTCQATRGYANDQGMPRSGDVLPLRLALLFENRQHTRRMRNIADVNRLPRRPQQQPPRTLIVLASRQPGARSRQSDTHTLKKLTSVVHGHCIVIPNSSFNPQRR